MLFLTSHVLAQRSDLSGIKICIDPGHGGNNPANDRHLIPDPGTDFWESESNFQKALLLKSLLEAKGASVILTRNTNSYPIDADEPSLSARVALANANNVHWFHSIHSNAAGFSPNTTVNRTLMLVREQIVAGGSPIYGPGTGQPEWQEAWDMSGLVGPKIQSMLRTQSWSRSTDLTFYSWANPPFTLGVLRGLLMPGQLSEGSFHDFYPETRRLMNNSYRKMEAYAIRDAFLQYFGVPADTSCIVAGLLKNSSGTPINGVRVRLLPENIVYYGDNYNNGFYMLDGIAAGQHTVRFETPGFRVDSVQVNVTAASTNFFDRILELVAVPVEPTASLVPSTFELRQNYPNPFNPTTKLSFVIGHSSLVSLKVFDVLGREVATPVNEWKEAGSHSIEFSSQKSEISSGVYFYQLKAGEFLSVKKMILLK